MRWVLPVVVLAWMAQPAAAEMVGWARTLGYRISEADCVVRAVITGVDHVASPVSAVTSSGEWVRVRLEVRETLMGPPVSELTFYRDYSNVPDWAGIKSEQLFFLETGAHAGVHHPGVANLLKLAQWAEIYEDPLPLAADAGPMVTDDLRLLKTTDEVLREARRVAKMGRASDGSAMLLLPGGVAERLGIGWGTWLSVGLTDGTFKSARAWVGSPNPQMQWCGAEVLVQQKSPENAAALRRFAWSMPEGQRYGREAQARVLEVLYSWGVGDLPPLVKSAPVFDVGRWSAWASLAGWLLGPAIYVGWARRRRVRVRVFTAAWWAVVSGVMVLGVRSYWPRDAVTWGDYDLAFERGDVYFVHQHRASSGLPSPLLVCEPQELLEIQDAEYWIPMHGQLSDLGEIGVGLFDRSSFAEKFWPSKFFGRTVPWRARFLGPTWQIPMWLILGVLVGPYAGIGLRRWRRQVRSRRLQGFPLRRADEPGG